MKKRSNLSVFMIVIGIVTILIGIFFTKMGNNQLARDTEKTTATVVDYVEDTELSGKIYVDVYYPVVTYEVDGTEITNQYSENYDSKIYEIGQTIDIKYNPEDPNEFVINAEDLDDSWAIILGGFLVAAGVVWFIISKIKGR